MALPNCLNQATFLFAFKVKNNTKIRQLCIFTICICCPPSTYLHKCIFPLTLARIINESRANAWQHPRIMVIIFELKLDTKKKNSNIMLWMFVAAFVYSTPELIHGTPNLFWIRRHWLIFNMTSCHSTTTTTMTTNCKTNKKNK